MKNTTYIVTDRSVAILALAYLVFSGSGHAGANKTTNESRSTISVVIDQPAKTISPDLFGIFFEDLNYATDGGLYAEMVQNRSFEYSPLERPERNLPC
jgi:hypothetical protein